MTKDIKDYLHLYLGCDTLDTYNDKIGKLVGVSEGEALVKHNTVWGLKHDEVKPILRPLSDMTEEEKESHEMVYMRMQDMADEEGHICEAEIWAETTRWLISKGFDAFQLIEAGLAIDKTTLKQES